MRMKSRFPFLLAGFLIILILTLSVNPLPSFAQSTLRWSPPQRIRGIEDDSDTPYLVPDQNRTVHAFNSQWTGRDLAIFYSRWSPGKNWTTPIDILLSPNAHQAVILGAFLDSKGMMHVAFFGGTEQGAEIYYSRAPAGNAGQVRAWSPPKMVGDHAGKLASGALTGDDNGNLFILYSGNGEGNGLYEVHSADGGDTWSEPNTVSLTNNRNTWSFAIKATLDSQGRLHAVWTLKNKQGTGDAVYYARLESDHRQWSLPLALQEVKGGDYQADWASIISYQAELFVIFDYGSPPQRWMRRSRDGGTSWSLPTVSFTSLIGEDGHPVLLVDGNNVLHIVFANRTSDSRVHGMWHSEFVSDRWSEPEPIEAGPISPQFAESRPQGVISQGNTLLVTWRRDPGLSGNGVWYSYAILNAPELPVIELPTPAVTATASPTSTAKAEPLVPSPTPLPRPAFNPQDDAPPGTFSENSPTIGIVVAILPVVLLLSVLVVTRNLRGRA